MTNITIELIVEGFDPFDDEIEIRLAEEFSDAVWSQSDEVVTATWSGETDDAVEAARKFAQRICDLPGAKPTRWYDDFVGYVEIARRIGVTDEAVRLWANNKRGPGDFPKPWTRFGAQARRISIWRWAEVSNWLVNRLGMETEDNYPSPRDIDLINSCLCWIDTPDGRGFVASYAPDPGRSFSAFASDFWKSAPILDSLRTIETSRSIEVAA